MGAASCTDEPERPSLRVGRGSLMGDSQKVKFLSTVKKDEAAFYLSELARGLLKNRISIPVGERNLIATFDSIHLEMNALEKGERNSVDIHLSWRRPAPEFQHRQCGRASLAEDGGGTAVSKDDQAEREERDKRGLQLEKRGYALDPLQSFE
jgi:amphi-Trp domain-containing protein